MIFALKVGEIMTRDFVYVLPDTNLFDCAKVMIKKRVGSLVLKQDNRLGGILTERDILWALTKKSKKGLKNIKAKDIATRKVVTIKPEADISEALDKMNKKKKRWLPVIANKKLIGLVTIKDILKFRPSWLESAGEIMRIREESEKLKRRENPRTGVEGMCEECGNYDLLSKVDGRLLCESCVDSM